MVVCQIRVCSTNNLLLFCLLLIRARVAVDQVISLTALLNIKFEDLSEQPLPKLRIKLLGFWIEAIF